MWKMHYISYLAWKAINLYCYLRHSVKEGFVRWYMSEILASFLISIQYIIIKKRYQIVY